MDSTTSFPATIADTAQLEELMSRPSQALTDELRRVDGDIMVLGVGGKMGPTLARMAKRETSNKRVTGGARFSQAGMQDELRQHGIECIEADLLSRDALDALPDVKNIDFMPDSKFGSTGSEWLTWAMNAHVPALVAERFAR